MTLANTEKMQIRQMMSSPQWSAFEHLVKDYSDRIKEEPIVSDSEWDTLRSSLMREGQLRGIQKLMQEMYLQIQSIQDE